MKYTYQDCWNYAFSLNKNQAIKEIKKDISVKTLSKVLIALCQTTPEKFWYFFSLPLLSPSRYLKIRHSLEKYFQENYPFAYLTKQVYFNGLSFYIEKGVYIPQPDTEVLFKKTCQLINQQWGKSTPLKILDIGTGCGNLAISLARVYPRSQITAVDISLRALKVVRKNVLRHQVKNLTIKQSNLFNQLDLSEKFNIIVANPPYIGRQEYKNLSLTTKKQPYRALVAKQEGYFFYQAILSQVSSFLTLTSKYLLIFEIGYQQKEKMLKLIIRYFTDAKVSIFPDEKGHSRVIAITK
ncbi:MAG: peptide chain release factor N(5)-glutamine methyltransferase [Candidatus Moeniiplasma glomeromycotorum]|nr:peptide chain release factor N(5)-glutamine methyltransferase [Candidatus Moeniiplasma glomeromycotorum]MCE8167386.1 peptide chain release factor N(5)-glutamine methyltransferase [Candidatus Moeniiplasma glomeromycotorum]MCE8168601.1 peptide chain release factor N(5)-glutamine methyltransferase [Candidatus Moeniiplasma glomeromycotorum]